MGGSTWGYRTAVAAAVMIVAGAPVGQAQELAPIQELGRATHLVVPQSRSWSLRHRDAPIEIERVDAVVKIVQETARTTLDVHLRNPGGRDAEAVVLLPVPEGAVVHSFGFAGAAAEPTAELLPRDQARRTYDDIVRRLKDPALMEFAAHQLVRTSVFPVPAGGTQRIQLSYDHVLETDGDRVDYVLPRSENVAQRVPWRITVEVQCEAPISMVYSPSHGLETSREDARRLRASVTEDTRRDPGAFLLSYLREGAGVSASLFAYPDPKIGGGYFLLMAGLPASLEDTPAITREVTLVLDRSGSMSGGKLDQAKAAVLQVVEGLGEHETFNLIDYSTTVEKFAPAPVEITKSNLIALREYLEELSPGGGTNVHDALNEALRQPPVQGTLPLVLFLTDGLPTVGRTSEPDIVSLVEKGNAVGRRVFTFGVGHDVNVPLLDRISDLTRAVSTYVRPKEDVELQVAKVFKKLSGPVLADAELRTIDAGGAVETRRVRECIPALLPDVFEGESMIVLGQYRGDDPLRFRLQGNLRGERKVYEFEFALDRATTKNAFVSRLWAGRRINELSDEVRQLGAEMNLTVLGNEPPPGDPRFRELTEEILRLSTEFGILSESTAFLALEGTDLGNWGGLMVGCANDLHYNALSNRSGQVAVQNGMNFNDRKVQTKLNRRNVMWNDKLEKVEVANVQQVDDRAFFRQGGRWVDSQLIRKEATSLEVDEEVEFGSERYSDLVRQLLRQNRVACLSLQGEILLQVQGKNILVKGGSGSE